MTLTGFFVRPAQIREFLDAHLPAPAKLVDDDRALQRRVVPLAVAERDRPAAELVEPFERVDQVSEERVAPHFAVGDDVEPGVLLQRDGVSTARSSMNLNSAGVSSPLLVLLPRFKQRRRAEQAADDVASWLHGTSWQKGA